MALVSKSLLSIALSGFIKLKLSCSVLEGRDFKPQWTIRYNYCF